MLKSDLRVVGGKHHGKVIPLPAGKFLVGREQDCQLRPNSELVSRHHCVFTVDNYTVRLRDLGSTNGTYVNNERITGQVQLKPGDRVRIGTLDFTVGIREVVENTRPDASQADPLLGLAGTETAELSNGETSTEFELPVAPAMDPAVLESAGPDTTIVLPAPTPNGQGADGDRSPDGGYPLAPDPYGQPAYYPPQGGYLPPGYPYQQPMMPYAPVGMYPQPMHMPYPMPGPAYQPQQQPPQPAPPQLPSQQSSMSTVPNLPVKLPDPEHTGVRPQTVVAPAPAAGSEAAAAAAATDGKKPSEKAAEIIRQHFNRRAAKP